MEKFKELCKGNAYPTTIHAINSCVIKLSKLTQAVKVWRGFKGATLPKQFFQPNDAGVRGGIEYGFSSTTTERAQAVHYAQGTASTIFEMQMGMVDRGADLTWLSQYPHEKEVLFPPLTGLEALATEVDGSSLLVLTRLSLNMASLTLEQVISRRRKTLMDMTDGMKGEIETKLNQLKSSSDAPVRILAKAVEWGHLSQSPDWFNNDDNFALAVQQALGVKEGVIKSAKKLPLDVTHCSLQGWEMQNDGRRLLFAGWLRCKPAMSSIDFRDAKLTKEEAFAIAASISECPKLETLNVLRNESMGIEGANHLSKTLQDNNTTLKSLCGIMPKSNTLEVPRKQLSKVDACLIATELEVQAWTEQLGAAENKNAATSKLVRRTGSGAAHLGQSWHPLIWAAKEGNQMLVETLLDRGHLVNENEDAKAESGFTPLMWAAYRGHAMTVDILLDRGADPTMENNAGRTAASLAEMKGFKAISELLTFVTRQLQSNKGSFTDLIQRAGLIKKASTNFKQSIIHASDKVRNEDEGGIKTIERATSKMQALVRGNTVRNLLGEVKTELDKAAEEEPTKVANLAKQAMLTQMARSKIKKPVMPKSRTGISWGFNAQHEREKELSDKKEEEEAAAVSRAPPLAETPRSKSSGAVLQEATKDKDASATQVQKIERGNQARKLVAGMKT
uniref:NAD(P)(+)--arginine ADP-ribosyltransferase n=1 Tax=Haptolina brevifila TaxID=156173 RepID=A0A7S2GI45_9EUKA